MMHRDLAPAFSIDPDAFAYVREYREGDLPPRVLRDWRDRMQEAVEPVSDDWRARLAIKVVSDRAGKEQLFPVLLVESELLP